ncbi:hypothetical protein SD70_17080 [Gordoniibacillus kamchatkensis]|uniref:VWA domain-containing protein n=1 Tax=Gordoniibacillus kamchatkensis TaxID=1590651 RepID=A0ABR5AG00_9BACL|nr:hypothetical protein [Paenibacillus sp. VKM B-2647]KIL39932.1 hypothetical protein SD70_17080 [Paenibacillus sp. VKM B-2647]
MMIECTRVDRYVFDGYVRSSRTAHEWLREARRQAPWFTEELFADFFFAFYLAEPRPGYAPDVPPFHRWLVETLVRQYFYRTIHPRTAGQVNASFKTALKALMWLTASYEEEVQKRERQRRPVAAGIGDKRPAPGEQPDGLEERLTQKQIERLRLVGYTLQQGKRTVEDKQAELDAKPLRSEEIRSLKERIEQLREEMKTEFVKRDKLRVKLRKAEEELAGLEARQSRRERRDREAVAAIEAELGDWLNRSLRETLESEDEDSFRLGELIQASQRLANRRWGTELGKLRRQQFEHYLRWAGKLSKQPDLIAFLQEVGRIVHHLQVKRRQTRAPHVPEAYDDLRQSGDIAHMLPSEASLLAAPEFEPLFYAKWLEGKLLTYHISGRMEEPMKGPVICMLDTSHSMRGPKLRLAQLFTAAFASFALLERRDFVLLLFGAKGELLEHILYHRRPDWPRFYSLAQMAFGGGTNFDAPLRRGIEFVQREPAFRNADFVMVTDGVGAVSPPVREQLAELGRTKKLRLHTLVVGSARQHLVQKYDIVGVSHEVRFAARWEMQDDAKDELLLDVFDARKQ